MSNETEIPDEDASPLEQGKTSPDLNPELAEQLVEEIEVETPTGEVVPLSAVMVDILVAHQDLDDYKEAGLSMAQTLKERRIEAEEAGNQQAADIIQEFQESAFGIYLRCQYGDLEVVEGERDGEYSDYFSSDTDDAGEETDAPA